MKFAHERWHMESDYTPAKRLAQYLEGSALQHVNILLTAESWNKETANSWAKLRKLVRLMAIGCDRIRLSEELLATAASFVKLEKGINERSDYDHWRRGLKCLEKACIEYYESVEDYVRGKFHSQFPDFRELYHGTIKKVMSWAVFDESRVLEMLISIFLQGIHFNGKPENWTVNSHQQCKLLAKQVKGMDNPAQLSDWLKMMIQKENFYHSARWIEDKLAEDARGTIVEALYKMIHEPQGEETTLTGLEWVDHYIYPELMDTQWRIQPEVIMRVGPSYSHISNYLETEHVMIVLKLEAILEQLIAGDGICCPYFRIDSNMNEACMCTLGWRGSLSRLVQWGREGKFNHGRFILGHWKDLPQECRITPIRR
jgi:hypothetical protein